jgi:hypothetical protein
MVLPELNKPHTKTLKSRQHKQEPQCTLMVIKPNNTPHPPHPKEKVEWDGG